MTPADTGRVALESFDARGIVEASAQAMAWLLEVEHVQIWLHDAEAGVLRLAAQLPAGGIPADAQMRVQGSLAGSVLRSAQPLLTDDLDQHPRWQDPASEDDWPKCGLFVPLSHQDRPLAVLVALSPRAGAFDGEDVEVVQALGAQVSAAILNTWLYEEARDQTRQLSTILDVNKRLALGPEQDQILARITEEAASLLGAAWAELQLLEGGELERAATFGSAELMMTAEWPVLDRSRREWVAAENRRTVDQGAGGSDTAEPRGEWRRGGSRRALARAYGLGPWLCVPLRGRDRILGVLTVAHHKSRRFSKAAVGVLDSFADQAAIAIENARLLQHEQAQRKQLEAIRDVTVEIVRELDLTTVLGLTIRRAAELVEATSGVMRLLDEPSGVLIPHAWHGLGEWVGGLRVKLGEGVTGIVGQRREGMIVNDYGASPHAHPYFLDQSGSVAVLAEPILYQGRLVGVITVSDEGSGRPFTEQDRELLTIFADQAAIAIENARLYRELADRERRLHELVGPLLLAQEEERHRVAYDIHDGLAQVAAAAHQHLEALASRYHPRSPEARQELALARELAQRTVREARRVIADLRPTALDDFGLAAALGLDVEALRAEGWQATFDEQLGSERLPPTIEAALFRVSQEALTNVRKHAQTTRVHLALRRNEHTVSLEVRDWGCGFQPHAVLASARPSERVGLAGMRERVAWLGGRCTVRSRPRGGTRIVVEVPLPTPVLGATIDGS